MATEASVCRGSRWSAPHTLLLAASCPARRLSASARAPARYHARVQCHARLRVPSHAVRERERERERGEGEGERGRANLRSFPPLRPGDPLFFARVHVYMIPASLFLSCVLGVSVRAWRHTGRRKRSVCGRLTGCGERPQTLRLRLPSICPLPPPSRAACVHAHARSTLLR